MSTRGECRQTQALKSLRPRIGAASQQTAPALATNATSLFEVTFRERAAGIRFQVSLEINGALLVGKLHRDHNPPRSARRGMRATTSVMRFKPGEYVRRETGVVTR